MKAVDKQEGVVLRITGGPSLKILLNACEHAHDKNNQIGADFVVRVDRPFSMRRRYGGETYLAKTKDLHITGIKYEDSSGFSFTLTGRCEIFRGGIPGLRSYKFEEAYYNVESEEGYMEIFRED